MKKRLVLIFIIMSQLLIGCRDAYPDTVTYTEEEILQLATQGMEIEKYYAKNVTLESSTRWVPRDNQGAHQYILRNSVPKFALIKDANNQYYIIEYAGYQGRLTPSRSLFQVIPFIGNVLPHQFDNILESLTLNNKNFVKSYLPEILAVDLNSSSENLLKFTIDNDTYIFLDDFMFTLYDEGHVIFDSSVDAYRFEINSENFNDYFSVYISHIPYNEERNESEQIVFEVESKIGTLILLSKISFDYNVTIQTSNLNIDIQGHIDSVGSTKWTPPTFGSNLFSKFLSFENWFGLEGYTVTTKEFSNVNGLAYYCVDPIN